MVSPWEAQRAMCAGGAQAVEPIDFVQTGPSTHTWVWLALIDLYFTLKSYQKEIKEGVVLKTASNLCLFQYLFTMLSETMKTSIMLTETWYLAKHTCISRIADTFVLVDAILALSILTGIAGTVIFIVLTVHP